MKRSRIAFFCVAVTAALGMVLGGCSFGTGGPHVSPSSALLYPQTDVFYPIGDTKRVKYSYPNRPFDTDITIEGIGWENGKMFIVMRSQVNSQNIYTYISKKLSPRVDYQGKTVLLDQTMWEEGSCETYQSSTCRYAVTAEQADVFPTGVMPESLQVMEQRFSMPVKPSPPVSLQGKHILDARVTDVANRIESDGLSYRVTEVRIDKEKRTIGMLVSSETTVTETSRFLLMDDKGRIYTFDPATIPGEYETGENEFTLEVAQPLPEDAAHLQLVIFETELQQMAQHNIVSEARIQLF